MNYYEITLYILEPIEDNVEIVAAYLADKGFEGSAEDEILKAYKKQDETSENELKELAEFLIENGWCDDNYEIELIAPKNWNEEWEKNYFEPILISDKCLIKSSFHKTEIKAKYEIVIDPKMSFGTGHHETTSMMVEWILELDLNNKNLLDMGTGTGILGILAAMVGAKSVVGIDHDNWCYENAQENIEINKISNFEMRLGDAGLLKSYPKEFDVILANINRHILLNDIKYYKESLQSQGNLIVSGFYSD